MTRSSSSAIAWPVERLTGTGPLLLLCDHASAAVPSDLDLRIAPALLTHHIAVDIGAAALTRAIAARLTAPALLACVSRLVIDLNRPTDHPGLIPCISDGHAIPGNADADRLDRIARFHMPYHNAIAAQVRGQRPLLIAAIHSFTPALESGSAPRPWPVAILSNRDRRAADAALARLRADGVLVGDNEPYSGRELNMTLNRHAEGNGIASLSIEVRNDGIDTDAGVAHWADRLSAVLQAIICTLAPA
ncbi:MAG: N-formylglutamate amidohydrolase [Sphingomonas sp.]|uniref:N-formylglutamate amidohydrolase n=1 Tax=Sphingomonas sp. TaxID=28214 RepID=UPI0017AB412D|nr:N-formylglutamate amidohydrolase [Zymomonas sp.]MBA4773070.1 N-formylglutamate amidohydrolase [Sphingomonas sp.]